MEGTNGHVIVGGGSWNDLVGGNQRAFERIYSAYFDTLYNYGRKYTHQTELVEDAIHDLFMRIWKNRSNLREPISVRNYLFKAFRNHLNDKLSAGNRYVLSEPENGGPEFEFVLSAEHIRIGMEQERLISARLSEAIEKLTPRQREAIFLRFYEEFSYPEIAGIMELSMKATYKLMGRAIDALRDTLGGQIIGILMFLYISLLSKIGYSVRK